MAEINQLEQLLAFYKYGTLSKAAEVLHISQPALSRSMQKLEEQLGVTLFDRHKNKMKLNDTGSLAIDYAQKIVDQSKDMERVLKAYEKSKMTISVGSCAPAPLWEVMPMLYSFYPEMTILSEIKKDNELMDGLNNNSYNIIITHKIPEEEYIEYVKLGEENLFITLPHNHRLANRDNVYMKDLDGSVMLLMGNIGFWYDIAVNKMPNTNFLIQRDEYSFTELLKASALPAFTTDRALRNSNFSNSKAWSNRKIIPILDDEVHVKFYCVYKKGRRKNVDKFVRELWHRFKG